MTAPLMWSRRLILAGAGALCAAGPLRLTAQPLTHLSVGTIPTDPPLSQTVNAGLTRILGKPYDAIAPHFLIAAFFAQADFINANKDAIQRFSRAMEQGNAFANAQSSST